jgi:hypothetical protein
MLFAMACFVLLYLMAVWSGGGARWEMGDRMGTMQYRRHSRLESRDAACWRMEWTFYDGGAFVRDARPRGATIATLRTPPHRA